MNRCTDLKLVHYADDSTAYTSNSSLEHLIEHVSYELLKLVVGYVLTEFLSMLPNLRAKSISIIS